MRRFLIIVGILLVLGLIFRLTFGVFLSGGSNKHKAAVGGGVGVNTTPTTTMTSTTSTTTTPAANPTDTTNGYTGGTPSGGTDSTGTDATGNGMYSAGGSATDNGGGYSGGTSDGGNADGANYGNGYSGGGVSGTVCDNADRYQHAGYSAKLVLNAPSVVINGGLPFEVIVCGPNRYDGLVGVEIYRSYNGDPAHFHIQHLSAPGTPFLDKGLDVFQFLPGSDGSWQLVSSAKVPDLRVSGEYCLTVVIDHFGARPAMYPDGEPKPDWQFAAAQKCVPIVYQ